MSEVLFYHLESARLEAVLPGLLEKTLANGWKAVVRCGSVETVNRLDESLWLFRDDAFLPHGAVTGDEIDQRQPILLTDGVDAANEPDLLFLVDGALTETSELDQFKRCVCIFDGGDDEAVGQARLFWKAVAATSHDATYWRQSSSGKWEKQA